MNLKLLQFKNYFDRRIQRFDDEQDYDDFLIGKQENVNFIPGDGVDTSVIVNFDTTVYGVPDYMIAIDNREIDSRWFVMSAERTRKGQTKLTLRRDLIAEEIEGIKSATSMVNKGYVQFGNDATFFTKEPVSVNEIPQSTTGLYQTGNCAWLVGYVPKHSGTEETDKWEDTKVNYGQSGSDIDYVEEIAGSQAEIMTTLGAQTAAFLPTTLQGTNIANVVFTVVYQSGGAYRYTFNASDPNATPTTEKLDQTTVVSTYKYIFSTLDTYETILILQTVVNGSRSLLLSKILSTSKLTGYTETTPINYLTAYNHDNHKVIKATDLKTYYTVDKESLKIAEVSDFTDTEWKNLVLTLLKNNDLDTTYAENAFYFTGSVHSINVKLTAVADSVATFTIDKTRRSSVDTPYDIIAMPYVKDGGDFTFTIDGVQKTCHTSYDLSLATNLTSAWGTSVVYDVQLVPYAPVVDMFNEGTLKLEGNGSGVIYQWNGDTLVLYLSSASTTFNIDYTIKCTGDKKDYICDKYKLVSPNYSNEYELPVFENGGIDGFNVDVTLFPYSPWIKLNPIYKMFNGNDLDDVRGLVLGGSYSITQTSSAWTEYVYNNSNYSQIFESQMAYQEYMQKNQMISGLVGGLSNALTTGAMTSALALNPIAGVAAGLASAGAGIFDLFKQNEMNQKANEYTRTQHELQLGNIKSKPNIISKITSININNKLVPQVVYYSCTSGEKSAVNDYLHLYGMSINKIDKISAYMNDDYYVSADIIDAPDIKGDANYKNQIKQEVKQGFFYKEDN